MNDSKQSRALPGRRAFLVGLVTGAGVTTALGIPAVRGAGAGPYGRAAATPPAGAAAAPILYRRTPEAERYYRTLYYA